MNQIIPLPRPLPRLYHKSRELPQASRKLTVPPGTHLQQHLVLGVKPIDPDFSELSRVVVRSCGRAGRATRRCSAEDAVCSDNMSSLDARAIDSGSLPLPPWGGPPPPARAPSFRRNLPDQGHTPVHLRQWPLCRVNTAREKLSGSPFAFLNATRVRRLRFGGVGMRIWMPTGSHEVSGVF